MSAPDESSFELDEEDAERVTRDRAAFGRYKLLYQIASGGMATVFLARASGPGGFDRPVAIKRVHPHLARRKHFLEMFLDEARIASRINHPNICTMLDFGEVGGTYYIAMEYLVGVPLQRLFHEVSTRKEILDSPKWRVLAARIVADAASGLHSAHETRDDEGNLLHIVHRDVSPQNLFVTFDGVVKVLDFGVARAADRAHRTTTGTLKGKLSYMAPEHAGGRELDRRADVWSLGVCLWEALTGRRLFKRENEMDTLLAVRSMPVKAPSELAPGTPPELDAIVLRALARDPEARYASARELNRDLEAFVRGSGIPAGLTDLAEFMAPLVQAQEVEKRELLATVLEDARDYRLHDSATAVKEGVELSGVRDTQITPAPVPPQREGSVSIVPAVPKSAARTVAIALLAAGIGAAAAIALVSGGDDPEPAATSVAEVERRPEPPASEAPVEPPARAELEEPAPLPEEAPSTEPTPPSEPPEPAQAATGPAEDEPRAAVDDARREVARRKSRPAPVGRGSVNIVGIGGWADIYVGRRRVGRTPLSIDLPVGRHVLSARPFGEGPEKRVAVEIERGETERLRIRMDR